MFIDLDMKIIELVLLSLLFRWSTCLSYERMIAYFIC